MIALALILAVAPADVPQLQAVSVPTEEFCVDCCNLYCAACPTLSVSHHLAPQGRAQYDAARLEDGHPTTAWVVSEGVSEWFQFKFEPGEGQNLHQSIGVNELLLLNGYAKSPGHWRDHARAKDLDLVVDGVVRAHITLLDDSKPQSVALPKIPLHPDLTLRFIVRSVYAGAKFNELALSEARIDGYGHH